MQVNAIGSSLSLLTQSKLQNNLRIDDGSSQSDLNTASITESGVESSSDSVLEDPEVLSEVMTLQNNEDKVIAHERAHKSVGGEFAGAASYGYTTGPDGKRYISSGEVSISIPGSGEPQDLINALERVKQAAMAPADPSAQDQRVAASASSKVLSLRADLAKQRAQEAYSEQNGLSETGDQNQTRSDSDKASVFDMLI